MMLAHAAGSGVHSEYLVMAGAFLVLGVVLFVQKTVKPAISLGIVLLAVALGSGAFFLTGDDPAREGRQVVILEPTPGEAVEANKAFEVETVINGARLASCDTCTDGGHIHVLVDGETVAMTTQKQPRVELEPGTHELTVEFVDAKHLSYDPPVTDEREVVAR